MAVTWKELAFKDGVANLSSNAAANVGTTAAEGVGASAARYDHVHELGTGSINSNTFFANNVINGTALANDSVNAAELATMTGAVNFNGQQGQNLIIHQSSDAPTAVVGKLWQDTDDQKLYICTAP